MRVNGSQPIKGTLPISLLCKLQDDIQTIRVQLRALEKMAKSGTAFHDLTNHCAVLAEAMQMELDVTFEIH